MEVKFFYCKHCGKIIVVVKDSGVPTVCCGEDMVELIPGTTDAAVEKHVPSYEIDDSKVYVTVNHVMEEDHYIEWISFVYDDIEITTYLTPGKKATAHGKYVKGMKIYSYCNRHGLWVTEVE